MNHHDVAAIAPPVQTDRRRLTSVHPPTPIGRARTGGDESSIDAARSGAVAMLPLIVGLIPFGLTVGAAAARTDAPALGWLSSILLYGGSGQLAFFGALDAGQPWWAAVLAIAAVNAHILIVSIGFRTRWRDHPRRWRLLTAYLIVSPLLAATGEHDRTEPDAARRRAFTIGAGASLWVSWLALTAAGMVVGAALGDLAWTGLVTPLVLLAMARRSTDGAPALVALASGAAAGLAAYPLWHSEAFIVGGIVGVVCGTLVGARDDGATRADAR